MPKISLDKIDRKILSILQNNGRLSNQEIAEKVNLSPSPCLRRIKRLEDEGVISQYVAIINPKKIGLGLLAYISIRLEKHGGHNQSQLSPRENFSNAVKGWPEVITCYAMTGDMDYLLRVWVEDMEQFSNFMMDTLLQHPAVQDVKSSFALTQVKDTTALPIPTSS